MIPKDTMSRIRIVDAVGTGEFLIPAGLLTGTVGLFVMVTGLSYGPWILATGAVSTILGFGCLFLEEYLEEKLVRRER